MHDRLYEEVAEKYPHLNDVNCREMAEILNDRWGELEDCGRNGEANLLAADFEAGMPIEQLNRKWHLDFLPLKFKLEAVDSEGKGGDWVPNLMPNQNK